VAARAEPSGWPALFWASFKRSTSAMVLIDARRCHVEVNGAYVALLGYPRAELIGRPVYELVQGGPKLSDAEWREALHSGDALGTITLIRADRVTLAMDYAAHPELVSGRHLVLFVVLHVDRRRRAARPRIASSPGQELTDREREIIELVAMGRSGPEIAAALHISYATVRTHVRNAQAKLGAQSRAQLVAMTLGEGQFAGR
jgi:DNA-binding CsgD family transcriptional regulator